MAIEDHTLSLHESLDIFNANRLKFVNYSSMPGRGEHFKLTEAGRRKYIIPSHKTYYQL